jgi:hypothetical protein
MVRPNHKLPNDIDYQYDDKQREIYINLFHIRLEINGVDLVGATGIHNLRKIKGVGNPTPVKR